MPEANQVAPASQPSEELFFNEVFGYTLMTTIVVSTYVIINLVSYLA